jgi:hypothetical protein
MGNENPFFCKLVKPSYQKKTESYQIAIDNFEDKFELDEIDNEWRQEYDIIYKSYSIEK